MYICWLHICAFIVYRACLIQNLFEKNNNMYDCFEQISGMKRACDDGSDDDNNSNNNNTMTYYHDAVIGVLNW